MNMDDKQPIPYKDSISMSKEDIEEVESARHEQDIHDAKFEKRVLRKVDWRLLPILGCLYTIALVDRSNVAAGRISGMDEDLGLDKGDRASISLMVFFIGYILFEIPSNAFIHKLGAANWLSFLAFAWGLVSLGIGFLNDWKGFAVLRSFLGVFEAGFFPGQCLFEIEAVARLLMQLQAASTSCHHGTCGMRYRSGWHSSS